MSDDPLLDALPELVVLVRRDGVLLGQRGGRGLEDLRPADTLLGQRLEAAWPASLCSLIRQLARKSIALRASTEAPFEHAGSAYDLRVSAVGPDRALAVIRPARAAAPESSETLGTTSEHPALRLDRRAFLRRLRDAVANAGLCEQPLSLAVVQVDGLSDIARMLDDKIAEQLMRTALLRLPTELVTAGGEPVSPNLGQLGDNLLAMVLEIGQRAAIEESLAALYASLREPIAIGDATFHLTPYVGVAILGRDATSPRALLDRARAAATEARRAGSGLPCFFSDSLRVRSLARLDIARELREAIANREIRLRYVGRHDLASGRLVAWVGYLRWMHRLRGEVRPIEFLRVAEATGLATALSRAVLECLREDFLNLAPGWDPDVRISFGALRHHILHEDFAGDLGRWLVDAAIPVGRLELRIAEKTLIACDPALWGELRRLGIRVIVDEVARGMGSLDCLARAPIWGLQMDRAWITALREDDIALKVCRAGISVATALELTPIATGVDDEIQRRTLLSLGCQHGSGDLYRDAVPEGMKPLRAVLSE